MKKITTILSVGLLTFGLSLSTAFAQSPEKMSYQAVIRNSNEALVTSTAVGMQISILQGSASGNSVYTETHTPNSNINGLVSLEIGTGTTTDDFSTIDWSAGPYFIKTETDPTGGTTYTITGTSQLLSVPYALHANTADSLIGGISLTETDPVFGASIANSITTIDTANWNNHTVNTKLDSNDIANLGYVAGAHTTSTQLDSTDIATLGFVAGAHTIDTKLDSTTIDSLGFITSFTEIDGSITNEIQTISRTGTTVTLNNGGGTFEDSVGVYTAGTGIVITNNVISTSNICGLSIGDTYQGGIIFYLDASGCHGLISALSDQSSGIKWHNGSFVATAATYNGVKAGQSNTRLIIDTQGGGSYAAQLCNDLIIYANDGLFEDWYLPSRNELYLMRQNIGQGNALGLGNVGNFSGNSYWNSTEGGSTNAGTLDFSNGTQYYYIQKNLTRYVRGVRAF